MPLNLNKLSALAVTKTSKPGYYGDGGGLWLQIAKSGSKSWIFRFKMSGKQREMGLGGLRAYSGERDRRFWSNVTAAQRSVLRG